MIDVRWRIIKDKQGNTLMWQLVDGHAIEAKPTAEDEKRAATKPGIYDYDFKLIEHQPPPWKKKKKPRKKRSNARTR